MAEHIRKHAVAFIFALVSGTSASAQLAPEAQLRGAEEHDVAALPAADPHRVYVLDPVFPHLIASKAYVVSGDTGRIVGMVNAGYVPNLALAGSKNEFYVAETYWSRGTRGDRIDVVTTYDKATLSPKGEVVLPQGRFLVVPKKHDADTTTDGRYLLSFNLAPTTSVSIVDIAAQRYIGEVEAPGCALVFPSGPARFSMLCADGVLLTAKFDGVGRADVVRSDPFFNPEEDPVFDHAAFAKTKQKIYFVTYEGTVHEVDLSRDVPRFARSWSLLKDADKDAGWRPGGWQAFAIHEATGRLYALVHKGKKFTHKQAGDEVWVFDIARQARIGELKLKDHSISVAVSQDNAPLLYAVSETAVLGIYDALSMNHKHTLKGVGESPYLLYVEGE
jgi:methylamine dehydrogenase heavy chain